MREDWIECEIGDVFDVVTGNTPSKANPLLYGGNIPFIKPPEINNKEVEDASEFLTEEGAKVARILPKYSVLITCIGNLGRVAMNSKFEVAFNQQINALKPNKFVYPKYIYYKAQSSNFRNQLEELSTAVTVSLVNKTNFCKVRFPLSPLPEQRAIVKKLESLFSGLDAGVTDLKKAQQQLKIYRQAVLKKAFEGELTNIKIESLVPIGQSVIANPRPPKEGFDDDIECQFVPMKLVEALSNKIHLEEIAVFNTLKGKSYTYFETGDVIFAKVTPCMENGKIAVAKDLKNGVALGSSEFHVFRCNEDLLNDFLFYYIVQDKFRFDAERAMTGAVGLRRVPKKFIEDYLIPLPSLKEQKEIVKQIESRLSVCDFIEQNIKESLVKAEALRQSILKKAFEGNLLTAQELAECKQAGDYEPASVLLERIKAEHSKVSKPKKKTKTT